MKNTFGNAITVTLFGESHGSAIGAVLDGLAPGIPVCREEIAAALALRRPDGAISTARREQDAFEIVSGLFCGKTTGTPLTLIIPNQDTRSEDYGDADRAARPAHADYPAHCKYHGFEDFRGGGHFSGRITAPLVAVGAILRSALTAKGIHIGTHIAAIAGVRDRAFGDLDADLRAVANVPFPVLNEGAGEAMTAAILAARADGDSVGGVLETAVIGLPAGVGEPWFDTMEGMLSHMLFSIPAVKGVEFGDGFALAELRGSVSNDALRAEDGKVYTTTNHQGGIGGGISNGMPILFRTAIKPTPSIAKQQQSVGLESLQNTQIAVRGRHDPCIVHRARAVVDAATAIVIADLLTCRFGTDYLAP